MRKSRHVVRLLFFSAYHPAVAQTPSRSNAKKEGGKFVFYTTMETLRWTRSRLRLKKKTGIQVDIGAPGSPMFSARALSEYRAGNRSSRSLESPAITCSSWPTTAPWRSMTRRRSKALPKTPSIRSLARATETFCWGDLTRMRSKAQRPRHSKTSLNRNFAANSPCHIRSTIDHHPVARKLDKIMPKPRAEKFIYDLAAAKPIFVENTTPSSERVSSAEPPLQ